MISSYSSYGAGLPPNLSGLGGYGLGANEIANRALLTSAGGLQMFTPAIAEAATPALVGISPAFLSPSLAIPVVGGIIAGVTLAIGAFLNRKGPQQKILSTKVVDEIEPYMQENLAAWEASSKTRVEQQQALLNFDSLWDRTRQLLNNPQLGEPGQRGIRDRDRGGKWDWFSYYRDPIANDPQVRESSFNGSGGIVGTIGDVSGVGGWGVLAVGLLLVVTGIFS